MTAADGLGDPIPYGEPVVPSSVLPMIDERSVGDPRVGTALAPVWLVPVEDPIAVIRAKIRRRRRSRGAATVSSTPPRPD